MMKIHLHLLVLIGISLIPASLMAQVPIKKYDHKPTDFSHVIDSVSKLNLSLIKQPSKPNGYYLNFQLPVGLPDQNKTIVTEIVELNPRYRYNMPIAKLENTSKILIATFDPEFPYHYNMPIKKLRTGDD